MTWNDRRRGWVGRSRRDPPPSKPEPKEEKKKPVLADTDGVIVIPIFPCFSPAAIADLLSRFGPTVYRSTVGYWIANGKLEAFRDNIDESYVLREELIRFVKDYLKKPYRA